jgi:exonuclease III
MMRKLNFLFWNLNGKNLKEEVVNIVLHHDIDVLILAEKGIKSSELLLELNQKSNLFSDNYPLSNCDKVQIFSKFDYHFIRSIEEDTRMSVRRLKLPQFEHINIAALHLFDKIHNDAESQSENASLLAQKIEGFEKKYDDKTIVIGDFNMNPFEKGMVKANGFNAVMSSKLAEKTTRVVNKQTYKFFYNPMWSLYGDVKNNVTGSYYYQNSELVAYPWNIFDQLLIRPSLIPNFVKDSLVFLDSDGKKSLLTRNGLPNKVKYSDHLPLFFTLKYRYDLFSVSHPVLGYPAKFTDYDELKVTAHNEQEFLDTLKQILSSDKTRRILAALLAQAKT